MARTKKKSKHNISRGWNVISTGRGVPVEFFKQNAWTLIVTMVAIISLMGMRYKTQSQMENIERLKKEVKLSESDKLKKKSVYMSMIRETELTKLVKEKNLQLQFQEQPPYQILKENEE